MKDFRVNIRYRFLAVMCIFILLLGCSPDKKEEPSTNVSKPQETEEQKPGDDNETTGMTSEGMITIYAQLFTTHTKGPVSFPHDKHNKEYQIACNECHHIYESGKNIWKEEMKPDKCELCHNEPTVKKEKSLPPDLQKKNLKLAFHNNCRVCHRKLKAENPTVKAPTTCSGCHKKLE